MIAQLFDSLFVSPEELQHDCDRCQEFHLGLYFAPLLLNSIYTALSLFYYY